MSSEGKQYLLFKESLNLIAIAQALLSSHTYEIKVDSCTRPLNTLCIPMIASVWFDMVYCIYQWVTGRYEFLNKKIREYDQEIPQSHTADKPKSHRTLIVTIHLQDNNSKAIRFLFLFKMIAKLKWTQVHNKTKKKHRTPTNNGKYIKQ